MERFEKDFKEWIRSSPHYPHTTDPASFKELPLSMQWGMYIDFFDEHGINIEIGVDYTMEPKYCFRFDGKNWSDLYYTREETRKAALEKAIEIYNQNT